MAAASTQFAGCSRRCSGSCSAEPCLMAVKPENQSMYMDMYHLSSAPMPELQGSISKNIWRNSKDPPSSPGYSSCPHRFVEKLLFLIPGFHGVFRSMCLEVLHPQADIRPNFYRELKDKGFHTMLTHRYMVIVLSQKMSCQCS